MKIDNNKAISVIEAKSIYNPLIIPDFIFEAINTLLVSKYKDNWIKISDYEILDMIKNNPSFVSREKDLSEEVISKVIKSYEEQGWRVRRNAWNEYFEDNNIQFNPKECWYSKFLKICKNCF